MGQTLERLFIAVTLVGTLLASCVSCVPTAVRKAVVAQERAVAAPGKLWPSVAIVSSNPTKEGGVSLATAWAVDADHLITAGHFCDGVMDQIKLGKVPPGINVTGADSFGGDVEIGTAVMVAWHNDKADDMCLLYKKDHGLIPLKVREDLSLVETEDPVTISGAPRGRFPIRLDGRVWVINEEIILLAMEIAPGNSGSPVVWNGEVIGMVIATIPHPAGDVHTGIAVRSNDFMEFFREHKLVPKKDKPTK